MAALASQPSWTDHGWGLRVRQWGRFLKGNGGWNHQVFSAAQGQGLRQQPTLAPLLGWQAAATATAKSLQSCLTLCDPIDGSPSGSPVPGILQARTLEWVAISFSNAWKSKVKVKSLSHVRLFATPWTAAYQAPLSMGFSRWEFSIHPSKHSLSSYMLIHAYTVRHTLTHMYLKNWAKFMYWFTICFFT